MAKKEYLRRFRMMTRLRVAAVRRAMSLSRVPTWLHGARESIDSMLDSADSMLDSADSMLDS